jgi:tRNA pseudouridine38-40 synthase
MDMERMAREAKSIVGTHDFAAFRSSGDERAVTERTIHSVEIARSSEDSRVWSVAIEGSAFLYNMMRILVGTLADVARGHLPEGAIAKALRSKDRADAGQTAPAHGLTLMRIDLNLPAETEAPWPP